MVNLTENEIDVLNGIAYHEMSTTNGAKPTNIGETGTYLWVEDFSRKLTASQVKGVISSLLQKELIRVSPSDRPGEKLVDFTEAGFAAFQANDRG